MGGNFFQYLQTWVVSCFVQFGVFFPVCLGFLYFNTLAHLACFGFSLNTFFTGYLVFQAAGICYILNKPKFMIWKNSHTSGTCWFETFRKNILHPLLQGEGVAAMSLSWTDYSKLCTWALKIRGGKKVFLIVLLV